MKKPKLRWPKEVTTLDPTIRGLKGVWGNVPPAQRQLVTTLDPTIRGLKVGTYFLKISPEVVTTLDPTIRGLKEMELEGRISIKAM